MTVEEYLETPGSAFITLNAFRKYQGLMESKIMIPNAATAIILPDRSISTDKIIDVEKLELINGRPKDVYMKQVESAIIFALKHKYDETHIETKIQELSVIIYFGNLTPQSKKLFLKEGEDRFKLIISADPQDPQKLLINDGRYANKSIIHFIRLQINAGLKTLNPETNKYVSLRMSRNKV
jgi:hypothetical protein